MAKIRLCGVGLLAKDDAISCKARRPKRIVDSRRSHSRLIRDSYKMIRKNTHIYAKYFKPATPSTMRKIQLIRIKLADSCINKMPYTASKAAPMPAHTA